MLCYPPYADVVVVQCALLQQGEGESVSVRIGAGRLAMAVPRRSDLVVSLCIRPTRTHTPYQDELATVTYTAHRRIHLVRVLHLCGRWTGNNSGESTSSSDACSTGRHR